MFDAKTQLSQRTSQDQRSSHRTVSLISGLPKEPDPTPHEITHEDGEIDVNHHIISQRLIAHEPLSRPSASFSESEIQNEPRTCVPEQQHVVVHVAHNMSCMNRVFVLVLLTHSLSN